MKSTKGELFAFAGIWDRWRDLSGNTVETCSILTTTPTAFTLGGAVRGAQPAPYLPPRDGATLIVYAGTLTLSVQNQPCTRDLPKYPDDHNPSCTLVDIQSRYVASTVAPRPGCQQGNGAGAYRSTSMRPRRLARSPYRHRGSNRDPDYGPPSRRPGYHHDLLPSPSPDYVFHAPQNLRGNRGQPISPSDQIPSYNLDCREIRSAAAAVVLHHHRQ